MAWRSARAILEMGEVAASAEVAIALGIRKGGAAVRLRRLRMGNNAPIGIQTSYLPTALVPGLFDLRESITSLYETLRSRFGIVASQAREVYRVGAVSEDEARLLDVPPGSPAFVGRAHRLRRARPLRIHRLDHARRPLRNPLQALSLISHLKGNPSHVDALYQPPR